MWPSAHLVYGIDLDAWSFEEPTENTESDLPWLTWELWNKSYEIDTASYEFFETQGLHGVEIVRFGRDRFILATKQISCSGWSDTTTVTPKYLALTDDDTRLLLAWDALFPGEAVKSPAWRMRAMFD